MRYPPEHKAAARAKLLETAGALAKEKGFGTTGMDALAAAAGMTSGALYSHFKSKPALLRAIIKQEISRTSSLFAGKTVPELRKALRAYLSKTHVENPAVGCPLPALTAEVARADEQTRQAFEQQLLQIKKEIQPGLPDGVDSWVLISQAVGAVMLARALASENAQKDLLNAVKKNLDQLLLENGK